MQRMQKYGRPRKPVVDVPEYDDLVGVFMKVEESAPEVARCFATKYVTGGRLNEWPNGYKIREKGRETWLMIRLNTLKNPSQKLRVIPVNMKNEAQLLKIVKRFKADVKVRGNFWGTDRTLERWYKSWFADYFPKTYPHFLREFRIHHVVSDNDRLGLPVYREDQLCQYFGWSDYDSARPYRHLREANLI